MGSEYLERVLKSAKCWFLIENVVLSYPYFLEMDTILRHMKERNMFNFSLLTFQCYLFIVNFVQGQLRAHLNSLAGLVWQVAIWKYYEIAFFPLPLLFFEILLCFFAYISVWIRKNITTEFVCHC